MLSIVTNFVSAENSDKQLSFDLSEDSEESHILNHEGAKAADDIIFEDVLNKIYENNKVQYNTANKNTNQNLIEQFSDTNIEKNEPKNSKSVRQIPNAILNITNSLLPNFTNIQNAAQNKVKVMTRKLISDLLPDNFNVYCYITLALTAVFIVCSITWSSFCYCKLLKEVEMLKEQIQFNDLPCDDELCSKREC